MGITGRIYTALGAISMLTLVSGNIEGLITGIPAIVLGLLTARAAKDIRSLTAADGDCFPLLKRGIGKVKVVYQFEALLLAIGIIVTAAIALIAFQHG